MGGTVRICFCFSASGGGIYPPPWKGWPPWAWAVWGVWVWEVLLGVGAEGGLVLLWDPC